MDLEDWNLKVDDDVKALVNVAGAKQDEKKQNVIDYFDQRNKDIAAIVKAHFGPRSLERKYGLP